MRVSTETFDAVDIIVTKRGRGELSDGQIDWVVDAYTRGVVADEQMSSLAMAILLFAFLAYEGWHILTYFNAPWE